MSVPYRQIRAAFDEQTVTVYQAYAPEIAAPAVAAGRFVPPFKRERMTWIKPSFLWMMYRSGWASKPGQERVLAVRILRSGFEAALAQACLSHYDRDLYTDQAAWARLVKTSRVRVQWDPERSPSLGPLPYRSLQVGLSGQVVDRYVDEWIVGISDVTDQAHAIRNRLATGDRSVPPGLLPAERPYQLPAAIGATIGVAATQPGAASEAAVQLAESKVLSGHVRLECTYGWNDRAMCWGSVSPRTWRECDDLAGLFDQPTDPGWADD